MTYSVLKVPLNPNQPTNQLTEWCVHVLNYVFITNKVENHPGGNILDMLMWFDCRLWKRR